MTGAPELEVERLREQVDVARALVSVSERHQRRLDQLLTRAEAEVVRLRLDNQRMAASLYRISVEAKEPTIVRIAVAALAVE